MNDSTTWDPIGVPGLEDVVEIGRGGFATVFRAYQPAFRRTVAVKVVSDVADDPLAQERFRRECQAMGLLSEHPSIVTVLDAGFLDDGRAYLVMPYMPAGSLGDRIRSSGPMAWQEASRVAVKVAGALHAAHDAGVIHRDVKPSNILVSEYGEPKLTDFGIARIAGGHETRAGSVTASLSFAPPELLAGAAPTVRSDLYSLGASLHALLTGDPPFSMGDDDSLSGFIGRLATAPPPDLRATGVPRALATVIDQAMAKRPEDRFDSVERFGREVRLAQDELGIKPTELMIMRISGDVPGARPMVGDPARPAARAGDPGLAPATPPAPHAEADDEQTRDVPFAGAIGAQPTEPPSADRARDPVRQPRHGRRRPPSSRRVVVAAGLMVIAAVAGGLWLGAAQSDDRSRDDAPTAAQDPTVVVDGYIPPTVDDPMDPPPITEFGVDDPLALATDHTTARIAQCPNGLVRDLSGRDLRDIVWADRDLRCTDFRGADLRGADLSGSLLWGSDFTGTDLRDVRFGTELGQLQAAVLVDVDLRGQHLPAVDWSTADLRGADLTGATLELPPDVILGGTTCPDGSPSEETNCGIE